MGRKHTLLLTVASLVILILVGVLSSHLIKGFQNSNPRNSKVSYSNALDQAVKKRNVGYCNTITLGRFYGDYRISVASSVELCKAEFAIETRNLDYCLTLRKYPDNNNVISQRDICLKGLASKLKKPELCEQLNSGSSDRHGQTRIETCKTQALDTKHEPINKELPDSKSL